VVVPIEEWKQLKANSRPNIQKILVEDGPRFEMVIPSRKKWRWRSSVEFE